MSWFSPLSSCNNLPSPWAHISIPSLSLSPEGAFLDVFELMTSLPALPGCLTACWRWPTVVCPGWPVCYISHPTVPPPKVKQRGKGNWWHSELHCTALLYTTLLYFTVHYCTVYCTAELCSAPCQEPPAYCLQRRTPQHRNQHSARPGLAGEKGAHRVARGELLGLYRK